MARETARLRSLAHPVRLRILSLLTGAVLTAAEVARELDLTHANASYHLRQLLSAGAIVIAGEERIRGGVAKRYRYDVERDLAKAEQPGSSTPRSAAGHRLMYAAMATELRRRSDRLLSTRGNYIADAEFWVDPEVWADIRQRIADASADLHRAARHPRAEGAIRVSATIALFRMEPDG